MHSEQVRTALIRSRIMAKIAATASSDAKVIREVSESLGLQDREVVQAIKGVQSRLTANGSIRFRSREELMTEVMDELLKNQRFIDILDQKWVKLLR